MKVRCDREKGTKTLESSAAEISGEGSISGIFRLYVYDLLTHLSFPAENNL